MTSGTRPTILSTIMPTIPSFPPLRARVRLDCTSAGPIVAEMLARVLMDKGANVVLAQGSKPADHVKSLRGLEVFIDRTTWVRDSEAETWARWPADPKTMKLVRAKTGREVKEGSVVTDDDGIRSTIIDIDDKGRLHIEENKSGNTYDMCEPQDFGLKWIDRS